MYSKKKNTNSKKKINGFKNIEIGLKKIENIGGSWGVLLDDIVAGIYSFILQYFIWKFFLKMKNDLF